MKWMTLVLSLAGYVPMSVWAQVALPTVAMAPASLGSEHYLKTILALVFVVVLILVLSWLIKRVNPSLLGGRAGLRAIASLSLGPKERLVVIECGEQQLLLAVTPGSVSCLHVLSQPLAPSETTPPAFAQVLAPWLKGKQP